MMRRQNKMLVLLSLQGPYMMCSISTSFLAMKILWTLECYTLDSQIVIFHFSSQLQRLTYSIHVAFGCQKEIHLTIAAQHPWWTLPIPWHFKNYYRGQGVIQIWGKIGALSDNWPRPLNKVDWGQLDSLWSPSSHSLRIVWQFYCHRFLRIDLMGGSLGKASEKSFWMLWSQTVLEGDPCRWCRCSNIGFVSFHSAFFMGSTKSTLEIWTWD